MLRAEFGAELSFFFFMKPSQLARGRVIITFGCWSCGALSTRSGASRQHVWLLAFGSLSCHSSSNESNYQQKYHMPASAVQPALSARAWGTASGWAVGPAERAVGGSHPWCSPAFQFIYRLKTQRTCTVWSSGLVPSSRLLAGLRWLRPIWSPGSCRPNDD